MPRPYIECGTKNIRGRLYGADSPLNTCKECVLYKQCTTLPGGLTLSCGFRGREKCKFFDDGKSQKQNK